METKTEIQKTENGQAEIVETTPATLIQIAIEKNVDIDKLERLLAMQERFEANQAKKRFYESLAQFQAACPVITKNRKADFGPGKAKYNFTDLSEIIAQIKEPLKLSGLTYRWELIELEGKITIKCIITHTAGHSEFTTMTAPSDSSGSKNAIQAIGSTVSYLRRYSLTGMLGIATAEDDVDGKQKTDGGLHPDMQIAIQDCKTLQELNLVWDQNEQLQKDKPFIQAITNRKKIIANGK